jgi:hypothetical protein
MLLRLLLLMSMMIFLAMLLLLAMIMTLTTTALTAPHNTSTFEHLQHLIIGAVRFKL